MPPDDDRADAGAAATAAALPQLQLDVFEGPLDLLLQLIERQELDITEVSLLAVTEQYMAQLHTGAQIDIGALASFVAVGARLLLLKSRALLPRDPDAGGHRDDDDGADPESLLAALREYRRFKAAAGELRTLEEQQRTGYRREAAPPALPLPSGLDRVTLDSLLQLFGEVMARLPEQMEPETLAREPVRLADRVARLVASLEREPQLPFRRMIAEATSRVELIVDFLAVLELIKTGFLEARQAEAFGEIELLRRDGAAAPPGAEPAEEHRG